MPHSQGSLIVQPQSRRMTELAPSFPAPSYPASAVRPRVALFVDGENMSSAHAGKVAALAATKGDVTLRRVYGNASQLNGWQSAPGFRFVHAGLGKNAADLLLCIEVMHVALTRQAEVIFIAASDRDYTHLASYLRESSITVHGIGEEAKAPESLRKAFCKFHGIGPAERVAAPAAAVEGASPSGSMLDAVLGLVGAAGEAGMPIHELDPLMQRAGFSISQQPEKTWRKWLEARSTLFDCDPKGPGARVRWRQPA